MRKPFVPSRRGIVMVRSKWPVLGVLILVAGCIPLDTFKTNDSSTMPTVGSSPFGFTPPAQTLNVASFTPSGDSELALRVDCVGRKVKAKNRDTGLEPTFAIIGTQPPEMFHQGTHLVWITEGLVKGCKTDGELAALLCLEMGKMASEREANAAQSAAVREPAVVGGADRQRGPVQCQRWHPSSGTGEIRKQRPKRLPAPNPRRWPASIWKKRATTKLSWITWCLLRTANSNYVVEKQFKGATSPTWTPVGFRPIEKALLVPLGRCSMTNASARHTTERTEFTP